MFPWQEKFLAAVQAICPEPTARVVVVDLTTGDHECFDLRPGGFLVLEAPGDPPALATLAGNKAKERALAKARADLRTVLGQLEQADVERGELAARVGRQMAVLAAVLEADTLTEAKARALWAQNPAL